MKLIEILALVIPAFGAGMYFSSMLLNHKKGNAPETEDIAWFTLNITFVVLNSILLCGHF
mgnify:CR=1 FL=1